jgi:uncharacterized cupin superfamily protein
MASVSDIADFSVPAEAIDARPSPDRILEGSCAQRVWNRYTDPSGRFSAGVWSSEPGRWRIAYTEHEFCRILDGTVVLTDEAGQTRTFGPGDTFVIPAGFRGTWESVGLVRKLYAVFEG